MLPDVPFLMPFAFSKSDYLVHFGDVKNVMPEKPEQFKSC